MRQHQTLTQGLDRPCTPGYRHRSACSGAWHAGSRAHLGVLACFSIVQCDCCPAPIHACTHRSGLEPGILNQPSPSAARVLQPHSAVADWTCALPSASARTQGCKDAAGLRPLAMHCSIFRACRHNAPEGRASLFQPILSLSLALTLHTEPAGNVPGPNQFESQHASMTLLMVTALVQQQIA